MAEETKKKGRPPKATTDTNTKKSTTKTNDTEDMSKVIAQMQKQMADLQKKLEESEKAKEEAVGQNLDLQTLVDALKSNGGSSDNLPNYVTVISLIPNIYSMSTENDGKGTCYIFEELGESKIISLNDIQKILGVSKYRKQAEDGYFYIVENEVNEYLRLNQTDNTIEDIRKIIGLSEKDSVERFISIDEKLQKSLADKMALDIANGAKLDRNKLSDILDETGIDIEKKARDLKKIMNK